MYIFQLAPWNCFSFFLADIQNFICQSGCWQCQNLFHFLFIYLLCSVIYIIAIVELKHYISYFVGMSSGPDSNVILRIVKLPW
jgi:hypothetical protein